MLRSKSMLAGIMLAAAVATTVAAQDITVLHYGGVFGKAMRQAFFDPAEKDLGIHVTDQSRTDMAKIKASVESGNPEWDVVNVNTMEVGRGAEEGLWEKVDWSIVDKKVAGRLGPNEYGVPFVGFTIGLTYSTKQYPDPAKAPKSWADFWDVKKFPGPRALENRVRYQLEFALLADGVTPDKLYPLDVDRAFKKLDQIKPYIVTWARPPVQPLELLMRGEAVMAPVLSDVVFDAEQKGAPVKSVSNQALYLSNSWVVVKGTKNHDSAMKFINTISQPAYEARLSDLTGYNPVNEAGLPLVKPEVSKLLAVQPGEEKNLVEFSNAYWAKNEAALTERWNSWLAQK